MEAAKRMFDNSYNQRQETAALAKAYLDKPTTVEKTRAEDKELRRIKSGRVCSLIGILSTFIYVSAIFGLLIMPLIKETELHRMQVEIASHQSEIKRLSNDIKDIQSEIVDPTLAEAEQYAREKLGMCDLEDIISIPMVEVPFVTLEEAESVYYDPTLDLVSEEVEDTLD